MPRRREIAALDADRLALRVIEDLPDYRPTNPDYSLPALQQMEASMLLAERAEAEARLALEQAQRAYRQARSVHSAATRDFRARMRGAKTQVLVQYGENAYEVQAVGWTRKSERRRPGRRPKPRA